MLGVTLYSLGQSFTEIFIKKKKKTLKTWFVVKDSGEVVTAQGLSINFCRLFTVSFLKIISLVTNHFRDAKKTFVCVPIRAIATTALHRIWAFSREVNGGKRDSVRLSFTS